MILFTGDIFLGLKNFNIDKELETYLVQSKIIVSNFENVIQDDNFEKRNDKLSILTIKRKNLENYLNKIKISHLFVLGNNHIHDLGYKGIDKTMNILNNFKNISYTGIDIKPQIYKPNIINYNNKKIALLSVSTDDPEVMSILATETKKGVLDYNDHEIFKIIEFYKTIVDYFVIVPHWGREYLRYPSAQQRKIAHKWIDYGVDLIVGHHPHVIQGKEIYKGKYIYYSLGNFIFPDFSYKDGSMHSWNQENNCSVILQIDFSSEIQIKEIGSKFNTKTSKLSLNNSSVIRLTKNSKILKLDNYSFKKYYIFYQKELYSFLKKEYSLVTYLSKLFPKHYKYNRLVFFIIRLNKIIVRWIT